VSGRCLGPDGGQCRGGGARCSAQQECCGPTCTNGNCPSCSGGICFVDCRGSTCCTVNGNACAQDGDCCGGSCTGSKCCWGTGHQCAGNSDCCTFFCSGYKCT
jgi:hypothetical protein